MSITPSPGGRTEEQIVRYLAQQVVASRSQATDYTRLSIIRTIGELQALLGERLEEELLVATAEGVNRATYRSFGFASLVATAAYGQVVFSRVSSGLAQIIPAGTLVRVPASTRRFLTVQETSFVALDPAVKPDVSQTSVGSTLPAGVYGVYRTYVNAGGESAPSPVAVTTLATSADLGIVVQADTALPADATSVRIYFSFNSGALGRAYSGANVTVTLTAPGDTALTPPNVNTMTQSVTATIIAEGAGVAWNTNAGTITEIISAINGPNLTVTNLRDIITGTNDETDDERRIRFERYIRSIHRATADAIAFGATTAQLTDNFGIPTEVVASAQVLDDANVPGVANCYVWNGVATSAPAASNALLALAQKIINGYRDSAGQRIPGYKAAGALVTVQPATITSVNVGVVAYPAAGWTLAMVEENIRAAILRVFARLGVGDTPLRIADLRNAVGSVRGVVDHAFSAPLTINSPTVAPTLSVVTASGGAIDPASGPTVSSTTLTSAYINGTYTVRYTWTNANGESGVSPTSTVAISGPTQAIHVNSIGLASNITGIHYYLLAPGATLYGLAGAGTGGAVDLTAAPDTTVQPPIVNSTGTHAAGTSPLPAGTYRVAYSWTTAGGATVASPVGGPVTIANGQAVHVAALTPASGATGVNYYLSIAAGSTTLALAATGTGAASDLYTLPSDAAKVAPNSDTSANVGGGDGIIIVPGTITIVEGK